MSELERKDKVKKLVKKLLARAMVLNAEFDSLTAERRMISEQIYELQSAYIKEMNNAENIASRRHLDDHRHDRCSAKLLHKPATCYATNSNRMPARISGASGYKKCGTGQGAGGF